MRPNYSNDSAEALLGMIGGWCIGKSIDSMPVFIYGEKDSKLYICEFKIRETTIQEMDRIKRGQRR
jgi:hypothetical protein